MDKELLVIVQTGSFGTDAVYGLLVAKTGEFLASHVCSHETYAKGDLYENRPERKAEWSKRWPQIEVKFLRETDITEEELQKRNKTWFESLQKEEKIKQ